jgi:hypothetical protein
MGCGLGCLRFGFVAEQLFEVRPNHGGRRVTIELDFHKGGPVGLNGTVTLPIICRSKKHILSVWCPFWGDFLVKTCRFLEAFEPYFVRK